MKHWIKSHKFEIVVFLSALIIRLVLFSVSFTQNDGDLIKTIRGDDGYYELSQNINAGHGFTFDSEPPHRPNPLRTPIWPYLIAFFAKFFGTYWAVLVLEVILGSFIPILGMRVARYLVSEKSSRLVAILLLLEPYSVLLSFILYTETVFTFFFLIFLLFLFRYIQSQTSRNAIWVGLSLGFACIIKPTVQFLPILIPIALVILFLWQKNLVRGHQKNLAVFLLSFFLVISPWLYRNYQAFGVWGISAQPAFNLYVYLAPTVLAIDNKTDFKTEYEKFVKRENFDENNINLSNSSFYKQQAFDVIKDHKLALVKTAFISSVTFFTHDGILTVLQYSGIEIKNTISKPVIYLISQPFELFRTIVSYSQSPAVLILVARVFWLFVTLLFVVGSAFLCKRDYFRPVIIIAFLIILYFMATTWINGFGVNARFRVPVNVLIFSFAVHGISVIKECIKSIFK